MDAGAFVLIVAAFLPFAIGTAALPALPLFLSAVFPVKPSRLSGQCQRQAAMLDARITHGRHSFTQDAYSTAWIHEHDPCSVDLFDYALGENAGAGGYAAWPEGGASLFHTNLTTAYNLGALLGKGEGCYTVTGFRYVASHDDVAKYATMSLVLGDGDHPTVIPLGPLRLFAHDSGLGMMEGVLLLGDRVAVIPATQSFRIRIDLHNRCDARGESITVQLLRDRAPASA